MLPVLSPHKGPPGRSNLLEIFTSSKSTSAKVSKFEFNILYKTPGGVSYIAVGSKDNALVGIQVGQTFHWLTKNGTTADSAKAGHYKIDLKEATDDGKGVQVGYTPIGGGERNTFPFFPDNVKDNLGPVYSIPMMPKTANNPSPATYPAIRFILQAHKKDGSAITLNSSLKVAPLVSSDMTTWWVWESNRGTLTSYKYPNFSYERVALQRSSRALPLQWLHPDKLPYLTVVPLEEANPALSRGFEVQTGYLPSGQSVIMLYDTVLKCTYGADAEWLWYDPHASGKIMATPGTISGGIVCSPQVDSVNETRQMYQDCLSGDPETLASRGRHSSHNPAKCAVGYRTGAPSAAINAIIDYCSGMDQAGYPRMNTDVNCRAFRTKDRGNAVAAMEKFCQRYPWHSSCTCMNYKQTQSYEKIRHAFNVTSGCTHRALAMTSATATATASSSVGDATMCASGTGSQCNTNSNAADVATSAGPINDVGSSCTDTGRVIPSPYCWFEPCTGQTSGPLAKLLGTGEDENPQCNLSLTFCRQAICVLCAGGNVNISRNQLSQKCGKDPSPAPNPPSPPPSPDPGPGPPPSPPSTKKSSFPLRNLLIGGGILALIVVLWLLVL